MDIKNQIRQYIIENFLFGDTSAEFEDGDSFMEKGILDSTGILELITFLETTYGVKVEDDELLPENLDSINNIVNFLKKKKKLVA